MNQIALQAPYGRIPMNVITRNDLSAKQKLVYGIIAAKQGETNYSRLTQKMIADAINMSEKHVSTTISKLVSLSMLEKDKKSHYRAKNRGRQYGMVELDILTTTNISSQAKFLYLIYCAVGNKDYDANVWGSKRICSEFHIGMGTYQKAHKELLNVGLLEVTKRASGDGIQTSNVNVILRVSKFHTICPKSWEPQEAFDVDAWCATNLEPELGVEPEPELSVEPNTNSENNLTRTESITNSNHNSNLNNSINNNTLTNEGLHPTVEGVLKIESESESDTEVFDNGGAPELDLDLFEKLAYQKLRTPEEAMKVINDINTKAGLTNYLGQYIADSTLLNKAFTALHELIDVLDSYGINTKGYALNTDDLLKYDTFNKRYPKLTEEKMKYHINRVVQLGIEKEGKGYISFSYIFSEMTELKEEIRMRKASSHKELSTISNPFVTNSISDKFLYQDT